MKYLFVFLLVFTQLLSNASGQNTPTTPVCNDKDVENFSSRGINLGMKFDEIINLFAVDGKINTVNYNYSEGKGPDKVFGEYTIEQLKESAQSRASKNYGGYFISGIIPKDLNRFSSISSYDFGFIDGKLSFIRIHYSKPDWVSLEQFVQSLAEASKLPKSEYWQYGKLKCGNSEITAQITSGNVGRESVLEIDQQFNQIIRAREKKIQDQERDKDVKTFKP